MDNAYGAKHWKIKRRNNSYRYMKAKIKDERRRLCSFFFLYAFTPPYTNTAPVLAGR